MMLVEVLVHDGEPGAFACCVRQGVVGKDSAAQVEQRDQHEQEERDDEGELHEGLATIASGRGDAAPASDAHGRSTTTSLSHGVMAVPP